MIIPDVNLLLYAVFDAYPHHERARRFFEDALNGRQAVGLAMPALFGFVRVATNRRAFDPPLSVEAALQHVETWLSSPNVEVLVPGRQHLELAFAALRRLGTAGNLTTDAQLAAYAMERGATLVSNDTDFARFKDLDWLDPLD